MVCRNWNKVVRVDYRADHRSLTIADKIGKSVGRKGVVLPAVHDRKRSITSRSEPERFDATTGSSATLPFNERRS